MNVIGILYGYSMGAAFDDFRWMAGLCAILPILCSILMLFNKESPLYLLSQGKEKEAEKSLRHFRGNTFNDKETESWLPAFIFRDNIFVTPDVKQISLNFCTEIANYEGLTSKLKFSASRERENYDGIDNEMYKLKIYLEESQRTKARITDLKKVLQFKTLFNVDGTFFLSTILT
ncbi:putative metabolite transport protein YwtG [Armadillidium vulgare]|nr:putative metabolite transport protein YwtG [Armadillidium vulgare]